MLSFLVWSLRFLDCVVFLCHTSAPQGMLLAKDIRDRERGGRAEIRVIEGVAEGNSPQSMEILNSVLGERSFELKDGSPDETADQEQKAKLTLYQWAAPRPWHFHVAYVQLKCSLFLLICLCVYFSVSDADGQMKVTEVATRPLVQDLLSHEVSWCNKD